MKRLEEAGQSAQKARSLKPDFSLTYLLLANIHLAQEEYAAQLRDVDEYLRLDPNGAFSARAREIRVNVQSLLSRPQNSPAAAQGKP
jgi:tetratricopeptide (TPR) repeat protein